MITMDEATGHAGSAGAVVTTTSSAAWDWVVVDEADGVLDKLRAWYLGKAEREGRVHTSALRRLVNHMYRDRDYLARR